jgi:6,7-dimethyl-8-ribityllumazine synthase
MSDRSARLGLKKGAARGMKIALVVSSFNRPITQKLLHSAVQELKRLGSKTEDQTVEWVPGALELPWAAKFLAQSGQVEAVICLGAVIRGETSHYDLVCAGSAQGVVQAGLDTGIPVMFGVVTCDTPEQALARCSGGPKDAGRHAAAGAVKMVRLARRSG